MRQTQEKQKILILGIGNVLMGDDSVGVRVVDEIERRFRFPEGVELLDGGTSGIELLSHIRNRDCLIIVDAIKSGFSPGTVVRVEGEDIPARFMTRISPHQLGLSDLLAAASLSGDLPPTMVLFGIEPKRVALGFELSVEVRDNLGKLVDTVLEELRVMGVSAEPLGEVRPARGLWEDVRQ
jgi:hydrogenase maturation protease